MKIVIFGLSISSAWGNGHATLWRGLCRELGMMGHTVVFFERDVEYYRAHRDYVPAANCELVLYDSWQNVSVRAAREVREADAGIVTSYCPDGVAATDLLLTSPCALRLFYDLDAPVTIARVRSGDTPAYIGAAGYSGFDLVLSYTGGKALDDLKFVLGAQDVEPLYGSVDPHVHRPTQPAGEYRSELSYLGTYAQDRQAGLHRLFFEPAEALPGKPFLLGGSQYPRHLHWPPNVTHYEHVAPAEHAAFYCSSALTLNLTRAAMAGSGWCPSGRLFEASACGTALISDWWEGLEVFYTPGTEIFVCDSAEEVIAVMKLPAAVHRDVAQAARRRTLAQHTAEHRAAEMMSLLESAAHRKHGFSLQTEAPVCGV